MISRRIVAAGLFLVGLLCLFQAAPDVGVLKGFHPQFVRPALAWKHGNANTPQVPAFAAAQGISQTLLFDDFTSTATIDVNNTMSLGFNWYKNNTTSWMGSAKDWSPILNTDYSVSNSILSMTQSTSSDDGATFATATRISNSPPYMINTVPLISGAKPFYCEANLKMTPAQGSAFWMMDQSSIIRSANNTGNSNTYAEIDITEMQSQVLNQHSLRWIGPSTTLSGGGGTPVTYTDTIFNTFGAMVVPQAYNAGTGSLQWYVNRSPSQTVLTWSGGDTYGIEASNFMVFLDVIDPIDPFQIDYVACWVHP